MARPAPEGGETPSRLPPKRLLDDLAIPAKVLLAPLIALGTLGALSVFGGYMLDRQREVIVAEYARAEPNLIRALSLPERLAGVEMQLYKLSLWSGSGASIRTPLASIHRKLDLAAADIRAVRRAEVAGAEELARAFDRYRDGVDQALVLIERNPVLGATAVHGTERLFEEIDRRARSLSARTLRDLHLSARRAEKAAARLTRDHMLVSAGAGLLVLLISLVASRAITVPIRSIVAAIRDLRRGELSSPIPLVERGDELGVVARSVAEFRETLIANRTLELERERQRAELEHLAHHDRLTGLANRQAMDRFLARALADRRSPGRGLGFLVLDLNDFKPVNDAHGHAAGDAVLIEIAARLKEATRAGDLTARIGGDEFAVVLAGVRTRSEVERLAARVAAALERPVHWHGRDLHVAASIGAALAADTGRDADALIAAADGAMYLAKQNPMPAWKLHSPAAAEGDAAGDRRAELEKAIRGDGVRLCYRPVIRLDSGAAAGFAVHPRWRHPRLGILEAEDFLPEVERAGLLADLSFAGLRRALDTLEAWLAEGLAPGRVSFRLPGAALAAPSSLRTLEELLEGHPQAAGHLTLEVAESCADGRMGQAVLGSLRALTGRKVRFALGAFGAEGRGALGLLHGGDFDALGIDGDLIGGLGRDRRAEALVKAALAAAASLGLPVVAAGVSSARQEAHLRAAGCRFATGPRYGPAAEAEETAARLRAAAPADLRRA